MKTTKITCLTLATALLASSCSSSYQAVGGLTGAMIGSHVGSAVGVLTGSGPFRGENAALGSLIGMGIGAILGVGITSQIEEKEKAEARRYSQEDIGYDESYYDEQNYQIGGGNGGYQGVQGNMGNAGNSGYQVDGLNGGVGTAVLNISELSYMDADGDGYISKDETIEVEGFITNTTNSVLRDIVISLNVTDPKSFSMSPSLTTTLQPGQRIRYTGRIHCNRTRGKESIGIHLNTMYAQKTYTSNRLFIRVK